jgi:hypothetical protein
MFAAGRAQLRLRRPGAHVSTSAPRRADRSQGLAGTIAATSCSSAPATRNSGSGVLARMCRPQLPGAPIAARASLARSPLPPAARRRRPAEAPIAAGVVLGMRGAARAYPGRPRLATVRNSSTSDHSSETRLFAAPAPPAVGGESAPSQTGANASASSEVGWGAHASYPGNPSLNGEGKSK